jgi:hypothetical protein
MWIAILIAFIISSPFVVGIITCFSDKNIRNAGKAIIVEPKHQHEWKLQYQTGNAVDGKSDVVICDCGQWAVYHRNPAFGELHKYHLIDK